MAWSVGVVEFAVSAVEELGALSGTVRPEGDGEAEAAAETEVGAEAEVASAVAAAERVAAAEHAAAVAGHESVAAATVVWVQYVVLALESLRSASPSRTRVFLLWLLPILSSIFQARIHYLKPDQSETLDGSAVSAQEDR